jgi:hypothetical protein
MRRVVWSCRCVPLTSRYALMSTDPHERFTLLSFDGFADDESSERSTEGLLRSTGAMHFRSADYLGRHDCRAWVVRVAEQPLT